MSPKTDLKEILVLEPDRLRGAVVARAVSKTFPTARVYCESEPALAAKMLAERDVELFVVALRGFDLDILTLLGVWAEHAVGHTRVLVMTPDVHSTAVTALRSLPVTGVFDSSSSDLRELEFACRTVASGATYWCNRFVEPCVEAATLVSGGAPSKSEKLAGRASPPLALRNRITRRRR